MCLTIDLVTQMLTTGGRPNYGWSIIALDRLPDRIGSIHVPDTARDLQITNAVMSGRVLAVTPSRKQIEHGVELGFAARDHVLLLLRDEDRDKEVIITRNEVVCAVLWTE